MGQGPDAESGESHICCKQPDGWVKDWDGPRMETVGWCNSHAFSKSEGKL